jgi:F-type H+-transporting ATPase subunit b
MPQLDITTWPPQLIWLAITFFTLYFIVSRMIIPRTGGAIEKRKSTISGDLAAAQRFKDESEKAAKDREAALAEARGRADALHRQSRDAINSELDAQRAKLDSSLAEKIAAAEKSIAGARKKALAEMEGVAADIAASVVSELTGARITKAAAAEAVAKAAK